MRSYTSHDAVRIIKYTSFFRKLKYFKVTFRVYPFDDAEKPGMYYIVIRGEDQFEDTIYEVNVLKKSYQEMDFEGTLEKISDLKLMVFEVPTERKRGVAYGQG